MILLTLQPEAEVFEKNIEEFLQGLEPIPGRQEDDSSEFESSGDDSSGSDSEVLYLFVLCHILGVL